MDNSLGEKIKSYFSDRIEEIKDGTYIPYYERIKNIPEFKGTSYDTFIIARDEWYLQHFHTPFAKVSSRDIDIKRIKGKRNNGFCILIIGVILTIFCLWYGISANWNTSSMYPIVWLFGSAFGILLLVIGLGLVLYNSNKLSK